MKLTNNKTLRNLLKDATNYGWAFHRGRGHIKGVRTDGKTITVSASPSDSRAIKNIQRDLR